MEQHPVPRNISGFQFHLVGDMTLKQFGYLAGGVILAYIIYKFPLPSILTLPLASIVALSGFAFAFVPIQERPLDRWLLAFIKSVYSPTQFIWKKNNPTMSILLKPLAMATKSMPQQHLINHQIANQKLNAYLASLPQTLDKTVNLREKNYIDKTLALFNTSSQPTVPLIPHREPTNAPSSFKIRETPHITDDISPDSDQTPQPKQPYRTVTPINTSPVTITAEKEQESRKKEELLREEESKLKEELRQHVISKERFLELEQKLNELLSEKEKLTEELTKLRQETNQKTTDVVKPVTAVEKTINPTVKSATPQSAKDLTGMPSIPSVPNIILGITRDNLHRLLPGIIVTVKDLSGMPMRAFKTNKLGQFAAATPLTNGTYRIEVEDPQKRYQFDLIEVILDGKVFMPIEIIAKGTREILRDKLTKEIFGSANII